MLKIYAVKDLAVQCFGNPFVVRAQGEALRSFQDEVNNDNGNSAIAKHPEDYELFCIGEYDEQNGIIHPITPDLTVRAKDLKTGE